jgi:photosystem II stability/assembly factor-like uncharacterized protein
MTRTASALVLALGLATPGAVSPWTPQSSGTTARLRGVSAVSAQIAWASGAGGTVLRTIDGGTRWVAVPIRGAETLDVRDVDAVDAEIAYALTIGSGESSRIYKTVDGGAQWTEQFVNRDPKAFFDALAFWDASRGLAMSDSVDGAFVIVTTKDGGHTWTPVPSTALPPALPGEGGFAASGTNVTVYGDRHAWVGTGAGPVARVLRTSDGGRTWSVAATPLPAGPSAGIFSIAFRDERHGIVVGGDYKTELEAIDNVAVTEDGGVTWTLVKERGLGGFRSAVAFLPHVSPTTAIAVGPSGTDLSDDGGRTWRRIEGPGFHALGVARDAPVAWGVGENGAIARFELPRQP